mgnify:FL=1
MKKLMDDIVPSFAANLVGLRFALARVVEYIAEEMPAGPTAPARAQQLLKLGRGRTGLARELKREARKDFFQR